MAEPVLRWGLARDRAVLGLAMILGGGMGLQGAGPYILWLLPVGAVVHAAGWAIQPAEGWRRVVAGLVSSGVIWLLLTGPQSLWLLSASFAGWLLVRRRPPLAWVTVVIPVVSGIVLAGVFREYEWMPLALGIQLTVLVGSAWLAALIARAVFARSVARAAP